MKYASSASIAVAEPALRLADLQKSFGKVMAVAGVDLEVREGECFGILGPNGAGKTTTIEICEGLTAPDSGTVHLFGMTWARDAAELRQRLGIHLQETQLAEKMSVLETVRLFRSFFRQGPAPDALIGMVGLEAKRCAWVRTLSGGQRQRLGLACALAGDPSLVFLDEPAAGLDPGSRHDLWDLIGRLRAKGRTIILSTHDMNEAAHLCDRVAIMAGGRVIALGTPPELIAVLGAAHIIEFSAIGDGPPLDLTALALIPGVSGCVKAAGEIHAHVAAWPQALPNLIDELRRQGKQLDQLRTHAATLEDVFLALTGRNSSDA